MSLPPLLPGRGRPFTGVHMLGLAVLFFGTIIAVNIGLAIASMGTWTGLAVENSYVASQEFDDRLAALRRQQALGWRPDLRVGGAWVELSIVDGEGQPVSVGPVSLLANRPVGASGDRRLAMAAGGDGIYRAELTLGQGVWDLTASASSAEGPFLVHRRISVE